MAKTRGVNISTTQVLEQLLVRKDDKNDFKKLVRLYINIHYAARNNSGLLLPCLFLYSIYQYVVLKF